MPGSGEDRTVQPLTSEQSRTACYAARDAFHACLDKHDDDASKCRQLADAYKGACMRSWRRYFDDKRRTVRRRSAASSGSGSGGASGAGK